MNYSTAATTTAVPCMLQSKPENNSPAPPVGRTEQDIIFTLDKFYMEVGTNVEDNDVLKLTTSGHPDNGKFFLVQGKGMERTSRGMRKGNYLSLYARRIDPPPQA